ncbi:MAG TPA: D-glycerate dehydrogenase [Roseiflexaceae bacterium]|nr:D-glycerate dehydrogenase [Roseiflexaceae bacterium]
MPYQILADEPLPDEIAAPLSTDCAIHIWPRVPSELSALAGSIDGLFTYGHPRIDGALMDGMPRLKVISNFGVGVDHIDLEAARQRGIPVGNTPGILDGATADMTFALLLAAARNVVVGDRYARSAAFTHYDPRLLLGHEVHGATLGIVGMGSIGRQVARRARGFDMKVVYHNRRRNPQAEAELGVSYAALPELLKQADFVSLNVPLTAETRALIGHEELALMKPGAILINAARGGVVDHAALLEALQQGRIGGAALDVTEPEPLPRDHPLLALENVIIAPHLGSATFQTRQKMAELSIANLRAGLEGQVLPNRVA